MIFFSYRFKALSWDLQKQETLPFTFLSFHRANISVCSCRVPAKYCPDILTLVFVFVIHDVPHWRIQKVQSHFSEPVLGKSHVYTAQSMELYLFP